MSHQTSLPSGPLVAFYGDDFTGSSAVMEVLSFAGLPTVLFLEPPTPADLLKFKNYRGIGIASVARAKSPEWMGRNLPPIFSALEALGAPITHYKTCSTLDSSPTTGSIGRAIDLGLPVFSKRKNAATLCPIIIGAPEIGRYQAFGNLFAVFNGENFRLDRHPVMRQHPATPMAESDVVRHISRQTDREIGLVDFAAINAGAGPKLIDLHTKHGDGLVSIDVLDDKTLIWAGREMWERRAGGMFAVGSQGIEYALTAYWRDAGLLEITEPLHKVKPVDQIIAVSGSVSPVTEGQIDRAEQNGFKVIAVNSEKALHARTWDTEINAAVECANIALSAGDSVLLTTARGPQDPSIERFRAAIATSSANTDQINARIGSGLGGALHQLLTKSGLRRAVISGGDTSGYATRALGIRALTALAPIASGSPLCQAFGDDAPGDGLEIALKGGQMGPETFFEDVRAGGPRD